MNKGNKRTQWAALAGCAGLVWWGCAQPQTVASGTGACPTWTGRVDRATVQSVVPGLASNLRRVDTYRIMAMGVLDGPLAGEGVQWGIEMDSVVLPATRLRVAPGHTPDANGPWGWVATRYSYSDGPDAHHPVEPVVYPLHGGPPVPSCTLVAQWDGGCMRIPLPAWTVLEHVVGE